MASDDPFLKEKGLIRGLKEKDRKPNGQKSEGSSETTKRRRTDNPMDKEPLMTPFSFVHWVVCPSLYGL
jgi:hypothetical protein